MAKVLVVSDVDWWVFHKIYRNIKKYASSYEVDVCNACYEPINHQGYDIILFLCDYMPELIARFKIPKEKIIFAIRQERKMDHPFYNDPANLQNAAQIVAASNENILLRYGKVHPNVKLAPGGVNTEKFYYRQWTPSDPVTVGWAGSVHQWGEEFRGLPIIREACHRLNFDFEFALGDHKHRRTEDEMVDYYHDRIDIYVEMSQSAGRQNGLVEAGACGLPVISAPVGIAEDLIKHGHNGFISARNVDDLCKNLNQAVAWANTVGFNMRQTIEKDWSWRRHVKYFEVLFEEILNGTSK